MGSTVSVDAKVVVTSPRWLLDGLDGVAPQPVSPVEGREGVRRARPSKHCALALALSSLRKTTESETSLRKTRESESAIRMLDD